MSTIRRKNETILVTGGAGFIGSNFIKMEIASNSGYRIINLDNLTYAGNLKNLKEIENSPNYKFIKGDITNSRTVFDVIKKEKINYIFNFAAESCVDKSILNPISFTKTNTVGTNVLLDVSKILRVRKFIQISTDEVYGSIKKGKFYEKDSLRPNNPYSASKAAADLLIESYIKTYNFPAIIIRPSNNFGPYQNLEKFIPLFITRILKNKKMPLHGDGKNIREWIHVEDSCSAIRKVFNKGKIGEIYNLGSGEERSNIKVAELIQREFKKTKNMIKFVEDRKVNDFRYFLDSSKIRKLGWSPKYKFEYSISRTIKWYNDNRWWWE